MISPEEIRPGLIYAFIEWYPNGQFAIENRVVVTVPDPTDPFYVLTKQVMADGELHWKEGGSRLDKYPIIVLGYLTMKWGQS